jgi:hypothetical protein
MVVSSVLCATTLSSAQCYGPAANTAVFVLDEFAQLKERSTAHWCRGVIGATTLSFVQLGLDLAWLGWVMSVVRAASGARSGQEGAELSRRMSVHTGTIFHQDQQQAASVSGRHSPTNTMGSTPALSPISPTDTTPPVVPSHHYRHYHPRPHVYHLLQTLLTPTPRLLTALAQRRAAESNLCWPPIDDSLPVSAFEMHPQPVRQADPSTILSAETGRSETERSRSDSQTREGVLRTLEVPPPYIPPPVPVYPGRT